MTLTEDVAAVAAMGGVVGREHRRVGRDGQDGHAAVVTPRLAVAVVTDGCSSGQASEVGARLFAGVLVRLVEHHVRAAEGALVPDAIARAVTEDLVRRLATVLALLAEDEAPEAARAVERFLLFGFLVAVITDDVAFVFGVGDGVVVTEDEVVVLDPGPENAPPYAAYALLAPEAAPEPRVHVVREAPGKPTRFLAVATDGLAALDRGELVALAGDARLAKNPSLLAKRLRVLEHRFQDDATMAVLLRRTA